MFFRFICKNNKKNCFLILAYVLSAITIIIVYITGGTYTVYTNFMYIPIALASATNGKIKGIIHASISGLILGIYVPVKEFSTIIIMQSQTSCSIRIALYSLISFIIGYFSEEHHKEFEKNLINKKEIEDEQLAMIFALVRLSESRDNYLDTHIERVAVLCKFLAYKLSVSQIYSNYVTEEYIETIYKSSQLHDIGKVGIPDSVLLKPGRLTEEEFTIMKNHAMIGANTLQDVQLKYPNNKFLNMAIHIAKYHHEKWDGTGYPEGLSEKNIPLSARIMSFVDVYDALRTKRVYKEAYTHNDSIKIIEQAKGTHFDPLICQVFLENQNEFKNIYEKLILNETVVMVT